MLRERTTECVGSVLHGMCACRNESNNYRLHEQDRRGAEEEEQLDPKPKAGQLRSCWSHEGGLCRARAIPDLRTPVAHSAGTMFSLRQVCAARGGLCLPSPLPRPLPARKSESTLRQRAVHPSHARPDAPYRQNCRHLVCWSGWDCAHHRPFTCISRPRGLANERAFCSPPPRFVGPVPRTRAGGRANRAHGPGGLGVPGQVNHLLPGCGLPAPARA